MIMSDKLPLQSKKFVAYLIADLGWKFLMFYLIMEYGAKIEHYAFMTIVTMIVTSGFIQIGYILGQAFIDRYVYLAAVAIDKEDGNPPPPPPYAQPPQKNPQQRPPK
jgi:hypothetical protein